MNFSIITIHGTFASRATWPLGDSSLSRYLVDNLPGPVHIQPFPWSGRNSFKAREEAIRNLRKQILQDPGRDPDTKLFLIAHSHGGNIAYSAACEPDLQGRIHGVICLSTPFLQASPRALGDARIVSAGAGVLIILANLLFMLLRRWVDPNVTIGLVLAAYLPSFYFAAHFMQRLSKRSVWDLPRGHAAALYILRTPGDEASGVLRSVTFVSHLVTQLWAFTAQGATRWIESVRKEEEEPRQEFSRWQKIYRVSAFLFSVVSFTLAGLSLIPGMQRWITTEQATWAVVAQFFFWAPIQWRRVLGVFTLGPLWWVSCILVGPLLFLLAFFALFFGPSLAFLHLFWEVSAESTPPGDWAVVQLPPRGAWLHHSSLYQDPDAFELIARWIREQASGLRPGDSPGHLSG